MTTVTLPALAASVGLSNLRPPFGSAASLSVWPPPPVLVAPPPEDVFVWPELPDELPDELLLPPPLSSSPPQPATGIARAPSRRMREKARMERPTHPSEAGFNS